MISDELLAGLAEASPGEAAKAVSLLAARLGARELLRLAVAAKHKDGDSGGTGDTAALLRFMSAPDFLKAVGEPPPSLVEGLIPEKSLVLFAAKPKYGKSHAALCLALSLCDGADVWGQFRPTAPRNPVCYLGMEDGEYEIANRLLGLGLKTTDTTARPLYICPQRVAISDPVALAELWEAIKEFAPRLLIVDTAREGLGVRDWSDAAEVGERIRPIREFAREHCSVLLIAHNRKAASEDGGDEISGSNAFASSVDGWISATKKEDMANGNRRLHLSIQGRGGMRGETVIEMDTHTHRFHAVDGQALGAERREKRAERFAPLIAALQARDGQKATINELATDTGIPYKTCQPLVQEMVEAKILALTGETVAGKGRPAPVYLLLLQTSPPYGVENNGIRISPADETGTGPWEVEV